MKNALKIRNLTKRYHSARSAAVDDISFNVVEGDFFALLGPNGSGKTTIIGMISSLIGITSGKISIFDLDNEKDFLHVRGLVGIVPQEVNFNPYEKIQDIVVNQAGFYGVNRKTAIIKSEYYLKKLDLWSKRDKMSQSLSGGMKRRLMIARALVHEPRLLILDEPTAGVDVQLRYLMWDFLKDLNKKGTTIILTTHYLEEAELLCNKICIINKGKLLYNANIRELINEPNSQNLILELSEPINVLPTTLHFNMKIIDPYILSVSYSKGSSLNGLFSILSEMGIGVINIRNKSNRLETLFVNLVQNKL